MFFRFRIIRRRRKPSRKLYTQHKESARELVIRKVNEFNKIYNYRFGRIAIRNQSSRWGSCSSKGNLNFNYKLALIPEALADYVVVHELCHLKEFNHSQKFWDLVAIAIPDYKKRREELYKIKMPGTN